MVHPVEGELETIDSLNVFSSAAYFFDAYVVRTQVFCGSLGIVGIVALLLTALRRHRSLPNDFFAALAATALHRLAGLGGRHAGGFIIHEYQMALPAPTRDRHRPASIRCWTTSSWRPPDFWPGKLVCLDQTRPACALLFLGISAVGITVRGEGEPWQLHFGRRIKAEVPAGAVVVTNEMSMVQTYYAERACHTRCSGRSPFREQAGNDPGHMPRSRTVLLYGARTRKGFVTC